MSPTLPAIDDLRAWARELGFGSLGVADIDLSSAEPGLADWVAAGFHGELDYMVRHGSKRTRPAELVPGTTCVIMVTMPYAPDDPHWVDKAWLTLDTAERAYVSRYALGRDYHKVVRARLQRLTERIALAAAPFGHRVFCDSAPVMEVELARKAGLGWRGKHTLLIDRRQGSMVFLGSLFTDLPLPTQAADALEADHCGRCRRCLDICPTQAFVGPYRIDARRCISYLTIESKAAIPIELRSAIGNRIYGCDDCQLVCPWNKFAQVPALPDFLPRNGLDTATLVELFGWSAAQFDQRLEGSPIRRIGHERWMRNLAVAIGNALRQAAPAERDALLKALRARRDQASALVREHIDWALVQDRPASAPGVSATSGRRARPAA